MSEKATEIEDRIAWLRGHFGPSLLVVDHWECDLGAMGVALDHDHKRLVYVAVSGAPTEYLAELETAPTEGSDLPYTMVGRFERLDRQRLLTIIDDHLSRHLFDASGGQVRFPCPCCGHYTLDERPPGTFTICDICSWEDDPVQFNDHEYAGGANTRSLRQTRELFRASERYSSAGLQKISAEVTE